MSCFARGLVHRFCIGIGVCLMLVLGGACNSTAMVVDWWKGDFIVLVDGVPASVTTLYFIVGKNADLTSASETEGGYAALILNGALKKHVEAFEYSRNPDGSGWVRSAAVSSHGESYYTKRTDDGEQLLFRVNRPKLKENDENALAVVVRFNVDPGWQGVTVDMNDFKKKEQANIRLRDTEITIRLLSEKNK